MNYNPEYKSKYGSSDDNMVASIASTILRIEPKNITLENGNTSVLKLGPLIASGSV